MAGGHVAAASRWRSPSWRLTAASSCTCPTGSRCSSTSPPASSRSCTRTRMRPGEPVFPVAVFNSPGYVITHVSAFRERSRARMLPLFSYGAAGWHRGRFRYGRDPGRRRTAPGPAPHEPRGCQRRRSSRPPAHARKPPAAAPGNLRPALRLPGREKLLPGPLRGPAANRQNLQRPLPRLPVAAEEQRHQLHPGADRLHPVARRRSRRWPCFTSAG